MNEFNEFNEKIYECKLVNSTDGIIEFYPSKVPTNRKKLEPGETYTWQSKEEREVFSPYSQITWTAKYSRTGKEVIVKLRKRSKWKINYKDNEFLTIWKNSGELQFEMDSNKKGSFVVQRGIPLTVTYFPFESRAIFAEIEILEPLLVKTPSVFVPGLLKVSKKTNWIYKKRIPSELLKVKAARDTIRRSEAKTVDKQDLDIHGEKLDADLR